MVWIAWCGSKEASEVRFSWLLGEISEDQGLECEGVVILSLAGLMLTFHQQHTDAIEWLTSWLRSIG